MKKSEPSPNDQRSNVKNPNNPAFKHAQDHRSVQLNPNDPHNTPAAPAAPPAPPAKPAAR